MQPVPFETALAWAEENAPTRSVERIHARHAAKTEPKPAPKRKAAAKRKAAGQAQGCVEEGRLKAQSCAQEEGGQKGAGAKGRAQGAGQTARGAQGEALTPQASGQGNRNVCGVAW